MTIWVETEDQIAVSTLIKFSYGKEERMEKQRWCGVFNQP